VTTTEHEHVDTTACPLDCPDTCSIAVTVTDGRITAVDAAPGNPFTSDFICAKVKHHAERVYAPERLLTPLIRTGAKGDGEFRAGGWDEALDRVVEALHRAIDEHGAESIVPYLYNSSAASMQSVLTERLFRRLGASEVDHTICAATHGAAYAAIYGDMLSADPLDLVESKLIVLWGANPTVTNTHLLPLLNEAQRTRGAKLVVVDPRATGVAKRADLHLAVRPGTDVVLALAIAHALDDSGFIDRDFCARHVDGLDDYLDAASEWTLDRAAELCGVGVAGIAQLAHDLATIRPAMVRPGWGLERNRNGGSACVAVMALPLLTGQFGTRGGGLMASTSRAAPLTNGGRAPEERHTPRPRHFNMNDLGRALTDPAYAPEVAVLFVQGANPAVMNPRSGLVQDGLRRDDLFTVVHDQVLTDTARFADVVLPACTHFEYDDVAASYGTFTLQAVRKIIEPVGEAKSNGELAACLAARLGFPEERFTARPEEFLPQLVTDGLGLPEATRVLREPGTTIQFVDTFPSGGRARLDAHRPRFTPLPTALPLALISPAGPRTINSIFGESLAPDPSIRLNPTDAATRGIADGDTVTVLNEHGGVTAIARVDDALREGVAAMTKGVWPRSMPGGVGMNVLVPDSLSDLAGGACFNDTRVDVVRM
jgi:anaerobic selenocysteine-containing dehydrogenase